MVLAAVGVACIAALLVNDSYASSPLRFSASVAASASLLLVGVSLLTVQMVLRPRWTELLKNMLLSAAFILWGVVQLMEENAFSRKLGNIVIALYVLDLAWGVFASVSPARTVRSNRLKTASSEE